MVSKGDGIEQRGFAAAVSVEVFRDVGVSCDVKGEISHLLFVHVLSLSEGGKGFL